jgi:hypothetical protein
MPDPEYKPVSDLARDQIDRDLCSGDPERISEALYSATYHDPDWRWVQDQCLKYLDHEALKVRWTAATCLGDLAMFHKKLELNRVLPCLRAAALDQSIRDPAETSISFIEQSVKCDAENGYTQ